MVKKAAPEQKAEIPEKHVAKVVRSNSRASKVAEKIVEAIIPDPEPEPLNDDLETIKADDTDGFVEHMRMEALKLSVASNPQHSTADIIVADAKKFASYILTGE